MSLVFPLSITDFFAGLRFKMIGFDLSESIVSNETGGGEILTADIGARLWGGSISLPVSGHRDQAAVSAKINTLRQAGRAFYIFDPTLKAPRADPDGSILGAATPSILSVAVDNRSIQLQGLPSGYVISAGDMLSFIYGGRYALHQVVGGAVADAVGNTTSIEVVPHIRPTVPSGKPVKLVAPVCKAVMVPGSVKMGTKSPALTDGASFNWQQTLR